MRPCSYRRTKASRTATRKMLVHSEVLALPIDGCAEPLHLIEDGAAVVALPLPHALFECLAAHLLARRAFRRIAARPSSAWRCRRGRCPEPTVRGGPHAPPADQNVASPSGRTCGPCAGGRSRWAAAAECKGATGRPCGLSEVLLGRGLREEVLAHPVFGPVIFDGGGVVGFGQVVRHGVLQVPRGSDPC